MALSQSGGTSPVAAAISRFFTNTYLLLAPVFGITIPPNLISPPKHASTLLAAKASRRTMTPGRAHWSISRTPPH
jgi:hypothetical protein